MATSTRPRYLVQIPDKGDWKTVAHFDDDDEARRTTALRNVRVLDTLHERGCSVARRSKAGEPPCIW